MTFKSKKGRTIARNTFARCFLKKKLQKLILQIAQEQMLKKNFKRRKKKIRSKEEHKHLNIRKITSDSETQSLGDDDDDDVEIEYFNTPGNQTSD